MYVFFFPMLLCSPARVILLLCFVTPTTTNIPQRNGNEFGDTVRILPTYEFGSLACAEG